MAAIFVAGNSLMPSDAFALRVGRELARRGHCVTALTRPEALLGVPHAIVIDCANVARVRRVSVRDLVGRETCSLHGFDLAAFLRLAYAAGVLPRVDLVAVPRRGNAKMVARQVCSLLRACK